jgi:hypothetical protein
MELEASLRERWLVAVSPMESGMRGGDTPGVGIYSRRLLRRGVHDGTGTMRGAPR